MAQCPSRGIGLDCTADVKVRPDGRCAFCGGVVGRPTDGVAHVGDPALPEKGHPVPGICRPPMGWHPAFVYQVDGEWRFLCAEHLKELYRRG